MYRSQLATVRYQAGTYSGDLYVNTSSDEDNETIKRKAHRQLSNRCAGGIPFGVLSFTVTDRRDL